MSRLIANSADELLADRFSTNSNVMGQYYSTDGEVPGVVVLGSTNAMPNPDLTDTDVRGRLRAWDQYAPPAPDSWNVYIRRVTTASGTVITNPSPMMRQNTSVLHLTQHTYQQDHALITRKALPDLGKDEPTDLAPPEETPRVAAVTTSTAVGYPARSAGALVASYFGIIGNNPMTTSRITNCAQPVAVPAILAGQVLLFYMPDEIPDAWTGVGFCVGPDANNMRIQKRVDVRGVLETTVIDRGPYRRDSRLVTQTANGTMMAAFKGFGAPIAWRAHDSLNLHPGTYELSYKLLTKQGPTASQTVNIVSVAALHEGEALAWAPPKAVLRKEGIRAWIPEFRGHDGSWYTFDDARGNGYSLQREARLHTKYTDKDHWKRANGPVKQNRSETDRSGVAGPTDPMEPPVAQGAEAMSAGRYAVRLTTANQALGMESAPSPRGTVTLADAGAGITNQAIRVMRPMPQTIRNSRLMETDPATGSQALHWDTSTSGILNLSITNADGFITVSDTTNTTGDQMIRRTAAEPIDKDRYYAFRYRIAITGLTSGTVRVMLRFLNAAGSEVGTAVLEDYTATTDIHAYRTAGPVGGTAHVDIPATATQVQLAIHNLGTRQGIAYTISNVGMWLGRSTPRKVHDLVLAEDTPGRDVWPVPDEGQQTDRNATMAYPQGPYVRTVTNPDNPAKHRSPGTYVEVKGFEDYATDATGQSNGWTRVQANGGAFSSGSAFALRGIGGALSTVSGGSAGWGGYIHKNFSNSGRATFGVEASFRIKVLPSTGNATLLAVQQGTATTNTTYLARFWVTSGGLLQYRWWNGTAEQTAVTAVTVQAGDDVRLEIVLGGLRGTTTAGTVAFHVKRNERPTVTNTLTNLNFSTLGTSQKVMLGFQDGSGASTTGRLFIDRVRMTIAGSGETQASGDVPGNLAEYWAPAGQPAHDPDHFITGARWPVKPNQTRTFSFYGRYQGITTPSEGASLFRLVSFNADGQPIKDHGWVATGLLGRDNWDRYVLTYTTASIAGGDENDAAYVQVTRNDVGDGALQVMGFQDELGSSATPFVNTNATSGNFRVIFDTAITGTGPLAGDTSFTQQFLRARDVSTIDSTFSQTVTVTIRAGNTLPLASSFVAATPTNVQALAATNRYLELNVALSTADATKSPEVRAVFVDAQRKQPVLCMQDGRDFSGGILVYNLTPPSSRPTVVRKEYADGSVGQEYVGRLRPPKVLKLSLEALSDLGKEQAEGNAAFDEPYFQVEANGMRYTVAMAPEFVGGQERLPDGTKYFDYFAEGIEADVVKEESI